MIIVPKLKIIESSGVVLPLQTEGYFTLKAVRKSGRVARSHTFRAQGPFHNLITNYGINRLSSFARVDIFDSCQVGTGTTPPTVTDLALGNYVGGFTFVSNSNTNNSGAPDYYSSTYMVGTSAIGALGNVILTEIGVSSTTTTGNLFSRELIRDGLGNPTTFPLTVDEQLQVTYELRNYPPLTDAVFNGVMVSSTEHQCTVRAQAVQQSTWAFATSNTAGVSNAPYRFTTNTSAWQTWSTGLRAITDTSAGTIVGTASSITNASYVDGSLQQGSTATYAPTASVGSIRVALVKGNSFQFQVEYDPPIVKSGTQTLVLNNRVSWSRR